MNIWIEIEWLFIFVSGISVCLCKCNLSSQQDSSVVKVFTASLIA